MLLLTAKPVIEKRREFLRNKTESLIQTMGRAPHLAVVLIGDDPSSQIYTTKKAMAAEAVGFTSKTYHFEKNTPPQKVFELVQHLNDDAEVDGILIQRPLPATYPEKDVSFWVAPEKDVDCLHPENIGLLVSGSPRFLPCTPAGILILLDHYQISLEGKVACVVGRSNIVGRPLASMLLGRNATVIQMHRKTQNPANLCKQADFVFVAAGSRSLVNQNWLKSGAIVIDVGIHRDTNGKIVGDVDFDSVKNHVQAISPVPGGVGPMTIQVLLENTFTSAVNRG